MATLPSLPSRRTNSVNLIYKIPTDKFICTSFPMSGSDQWTYSTEIIVEKQWDYPDITPTDWTVSLTMNSVSGEITTSATAKDSGLVVPDEIDPVDPAAAVSMEAWIRAGADAPHDVWMGVECVAAAGQKLDPLTEEFTDSYGNPGCQLRKGMDVFITLTFYAEKTCSRADLQNLIGSRTLTDCTLICEGEEFPAHRAILAAQSPVFTAMFQDEMKEKTSGVCTIDDIGRDVLGTMLKFSYGRMELDGKGKLDELWIAADKYDMKDLCAECERMMVLTISSDNAVKRFQFAEEYKLKELKMAAMKLIVHFSIRI